MMDDETTPGEHLQEQVAGPSHQEDGEMQVDEHQIDHARVQLPPTHARGEVPLNRKCSVCGHAAAPHLHYGALSCYSCRAFFRRGPPKQMRCIFGNNECDINQHNRTNCKHCRYKRCLQVGMIPDKVDAIVRKRARLQAEAEARNTGSNDGDAAAVPDIAAASQPDQHRTPEHEQPLHQQTSPATPNIPSAAAATLLSVQIKEEPPSNIEMSPGSGPASEPPPPPLMLLPAAMRANNSVISIRRPSSLFENNEDRARSTNSGTRWHGMLPPSPTVASPSDIAARRTSGGVFRHSSSVVGDGSSVVCKMEQSPVTQHHAQIGSPNTTTSSAVVATASVLRMCKDVTKAAPITTSHNSAILNLLSGDTKNATSVIQMTKPSQPRHVNQFHADKSDRNPATPYSSNGNDWRSCQASTSRDTQYSVAPPSTSTSDNRSGDNKCEARSIVQTRLHNPVDDDNRRVPDHQESPLHEMPWLLKSSKPGDGKFNDAGRWNYNASTSSSHIQSNTLVNSVNPTPMSHDMPTDLTQYSNPLHNPFYWNYQMPQNYLTTQFKSTRQSNEDPQNNAMTNQFDPGHLMKQRFDRNFALNQNKHFNFADQYLPLELTATKNENVVSEEVDFVEEQGDRTPTTPEFKPYPSTSTCQNPYASGKLNPDQQLFAKFDIDPSLQQLCFLEEAPKSLEEIISSSDEMNSTSTNHSSQIVPEVNCDASELVDPFLPETWADHSGRSVGSGFKSDDFSDIEADNLYPEDKEAVGKKRKAENNQVEAKKTKSNQTKESPVPLKKRRRMYQCTYPTTHALNSKALPLLPFTYEEEFLLADYIYRIEDYQNNRVGFLLKNFTSYLTLLVTYVQCAKLNCKVPFSKKIEQTLCVLGLEFTKSQAAKMFTELSHLGTDVRRKVLHSTYPALYVLFFSILEGNTNSRTWMEQQRKTLYITQHTHSLIMEHVRGLTDVRSIGIKDQERFTSPWAQSKKDEEMFEKTISIVGRLIGDDKNLQALYHMLVMLTPAADTPLAVQMDSTLQNMQVHVSRLIYRYLNNVKSNTVNNETDVSVGDQLVEESVVMKLTADMPDLEPADKTRLLIHMIDAVHDCAKIMRQRSLPGQTEPDFFKKHFQF